MDTDMFSTTDLNDKEKRILDAAIKIFSEKGFNAASTSEIAKSAKVAEGTIFRYFKTKKDILKKIIIQMLNLFSGKLVLSSIEKILEENDDDLRVVLKKILVDRIRLTENVFPVARIVLTESLYDEEVREAIFNNIILRAINMYEKFHLKMQEKGAIRKDLDHGTAFRSIFANIFAFIAQRKLYGDKFEFGKLEDEVDKIIDVIIRGLSGNTQ